MYMYERRACQGQWLLGAELFKTFDKILCPFITRFLALLYPLLVKIRALLKFKHDSEHAT